VTDPSWLFFTDINVNLSAEVAKRFVELLKDRQAKTQLFAEAVILSKRLQQELLKQDLRERLAKLGSSLESGKFQLVIFCRAHRGGAC
jgi:hypothetical protein